MKNILLSIFTLAGFIALQAQVQKKPLIEHFTQASCVPCATQNPMLKTTLDAYGETNYVRISHQTSWPGSDPMNAAFPEGPLDRVIYYGVEGVPDTSLNGGTTGFPNSIVTSSSLASAATVMTPYSITATQTWANPNELTVNIDVENVTGTAISSADRIYVTMVEDEVVYPSAPGANGETSFEYVMRQMYNASTGEPSATTGAVLGTIDAMSSTNFNFTITDLPSYLRDKTQVSFAIYIQNNATKEILQAEKTYPTEDIPEIIFVSAASATTAGSGYCDYAITPGIEFTNNDPNTTVTEVVAEYTINDGTTEQQTFTGSLTNGQSTTITFPESTLSAGTNILYSEIISVNGNQYWASTASVSIPNDTYRRLNSESIPAPILEGFEDGVIASNVGYSRDLETAIFDADASISESQFTILDGPIIGLGAIGGFGNSNRSVVFQFYAIPSGEMNLIFQKVELGSNSTLTFDHTYRQYINENDRLEILVSTDCGSTWTNVFNKAGSELATLTPLTSQYLPSGVNGWLNNSIDLSAYNNMDDVLIRFKATSAYGNNMFIDNISMNSTLSVDDVARLNSIKLHPNPSSDFIQISGLTTVENYSIYNVLGAKVSQGTVVNNQSINIEDYSNGIYFLKFDNGNTLKFTKK
ncbi:T9SS-dependent choice-of-anchor J family protein [Winogradskyella vidalii]|uniref:T9SS-dependent choice-of-anchor J family protein n=1 Tax=Winogradskyella vidalii TaxID=2615024 RepID=UPI0015CCB13E|nr:T9SS type A sorting domain-containing protein [Winogradskyella vidalii]